ncbi:MarR family winged helix-turn-helix transcriptional regulator [Cognatishimia activa]|uniref:MarR family winged helix-turn-helix transcriptional regulator n=1 Tax=Cognatishimia activa TaxID=1715691 RepID=UPI00222EE3D2|nr:MarR family transcriptional regulator [Cognatishimia activa]UZD90308.1 MarR family transcriptional regulator [Cognatishimia activa]
MQDLKSIGEGAIVAMSKNNARQLGWSLSFLMKLSKQPGMRKASLGFLIQIMARRIEDGMKSLLNEHEIDIKNFPNLITLRDHDGLSQRELGRYMDFPEYSTSRHVDSLVRDGYAERRPDPNSRRAVKVHLTKIGREKADLLPGIIRESNRNVLKGLEPEEAEQLLILLQKLVSTTEK